jgi:hypothetical protein
VVALGTITQGALPRENLPDELPYIIDKERLGGTQARVKLQIDERLEEPIYRTAIAAEPRLQDLMILRFANFSTFEVSPQHSTALLEMIEEMRDRPAPPPEGPECRVWIYAPGEDAEYWDEFYESGIMAIGWDRLGDLSQFGSLDDILAALQRGQESERRPTNNARACYDFVHTLHVGDRVFAKRGRNTIVGYGVVTGEYEYHPERLNFKNVRTISWQTRGTWTSPESVAIKTLTDITAYADFVNALDKLISGQVTEPPSYSTRYRKAKASKGLTGSFGDRSWPRKAII